MNNYAIILAAGDGKRLGSKTPKCFIKIDNKPIYQYSLELFEILSQIKQVVLVVPKQYLSSVKPDNKKVKVVAGGKTRNESFECGIKAIKKPKLTDKIIVHDGARMYVSIEDILRVTNCKKTYGTLCYKGKKNLSDLRINNYNILTPQFCLYSIYKKAKKNEKGRDLLTYLNLAFNKNNLLIVKSGSKNTKITFKKDLLKTKL